HHHSRNGAKKAAAGQGRRGWPGQARGRRQAGAERRQGLQRGALGQMVGHRSERRRRGSGDCLVTRRDGSTGLSERGATANLPDDISANVLALMRQTAEAELLPRFGRLEKSDIREKKPGDLVTVADVAAEQRLTEGLNRILPGIVVVGEEAVSADPPLIKS